MEIMVQPQSWRHTVLITVAPLRHSKEAEHLPKDLICINAHVVVVVVGGGDCSRKGGKGGLHMEDEMRQFWKLKRDCR